MSNVLRRGHVSILGQPLHGVALDILVKNSQKGMFGTRFFQDAGGLLAAGFEESKDDIFFVNTMPAVGAKKVSGGRQGVRTSTGFLRASSQMVGGKNCFEKVTRTVVMFLSVGPLEQLTALGQLGHSGEVAGKGRVHTCFHWRFSHWIPGNTVVAFGLLVIMRIFQDEDEGLGKVMGVGQEAAVETVKENRDAAICHPVLPPPQVWQQHGEEQTFHRSTTFLLMRRPF